MIMDKTVFNDLDGYEKGVVARALLQGMIKRGFIEDRPSENGQISEIVIPVEQWQMELLACFSGETGPAEADLENIREVLCHVR